jgi:thioredoxin-related protein
VKPRIKLGQIMLLLFLVSACTKTELIVPTELRLSPPEKPSLYIFCSNDDVICLDRDEVRDYFALEYGEAEVYANYIFIENSDWGRGLFEYFELSNTPSFVFVNVEGDALYQSEGELNLDELDVYISSIMDNQE